MPPQLAPHVATSFDPMAQTVWQILRIEIKVKTDKRLKIIRGVGVGPIFFPAGDPNVNMYVQVKFGDDSITRSYVMN